MRFAVIKRRYTSNQRQQDCECNGSLKKAYKSLNLEAQDVEINRFVAVAVDGQVTVYGRRMNAAASESANFATSGARIVFARRRFTSRVGTCFGIGIICKGLTLGSPRVTP